MSCVISSVSIISSTQSIGIPAATRPRTLMVTPFFVEVELRFSTRSALEIPK